MDKYNSIAGEQLEFNLSSEERPISSGYAISRSAWLPDQTRQVAALKNDQEKIDLSLIPYVAQVAEAKALMVGAKKYARYNYTNGHKASQLMSALLRHANAWFSGEENDPVDGQPHLGSVKACCSMILHQMELGTMTDDRFKPTKGEK